MNSRRKALDKAHRIATAEARTMSCLVCRIGPCVPAHWPVHRGMGGAKAGWERHEWEPLCPYHHDLVDGRLGVSERVERERRQAVQILEARRAPRRPR